MDLVYLHYTGILNFPVITTVFISVQILHTRPMKYPVLFKEK